MSKFSRLSVFGVLLAVAAVSFVGCVLNPGNNDSSSAPPSVLTPDTTDKYFGTNGLLVNPIEYTSSGASGSVKFSHYTHVSNSKLACTQCHSDNGIGSGTFPMGTGTTGSSVRAKAASKSLGGMSNLLAGNYCGKCHNGSVAFSLAGNCAKCHTTLPSNGPKEVKMLTKAGTVTFSHERHVDSFKKGCNDCHLNDTPWKMVYYVGSHTMADMEAGKSCGLCHTGKSGAGFALTQCSRCHETFNHASYKGTTDAKVCAECHQGVYDEYAVSAASSANPLITTKVGHGGNFLTRYAGGPSNPSGACSECHYHEAVFGKATAMKEAMLNKSASDISCQTCHFDADDATGRTTSRLRVSPGNDLCGRCHHLRYTYGSNPLSSTNGHQNPLSTTAAQFGIAPWNDSGFPKLLAWNIADSTSGDPLDLSTTRPTVASWVLLATAPTPIVIYYVSELGDLSRFATTSVVLAAAANASGGLILDNLAKNGFLGKSGSTYRGAAYPHYSAQYDLMMGTRTDTLVKFSKRSNGSALTYTDTPHYNYSDACIRCHMNADRDNKKYGHTWNHRIENCQKCHSTMTEAKVKEYEEEIEALVTTLGKKLDANGNGTVSWTRGSGSGLTALDADLQVVLNHSQLASSTKAIMLGVAWNFVAIHEDGSEGIHNYKFVKSLLENGITIMDDLKASALDKAAITWY